MYPWGVPPRVSSRSDYPHVMALHSSDSLVESLNHVARPVWVHSSLFSHTVQDGELAVIVGFVFCTDCDAVRHVEDPVAPAVGQGLSACPV